MQTLCASFSLPTSPTPLHVQRSKLVKLESKKTFYMPPESPNNLAIWTKKLKHLLVSKRLDEAKNLFVELRSNGVEFGFITKTMLIDAFFKFGRVSDACQVFETMPERSVVTWTSMVSGFARNGLPSVGFCVFVEMLEAGVVPNDFAFSAVLHACTDLGVLELGQQVHSMVVRFGLASDCRIANWLIDVYSRCRLIDKAQLIFEKMADRDVVTFTTLISGFCVNNLFISAVRVFGQMLSEGIEPNEHTISSVLTACGSTLGKQIHGYMIKTMTDRSVFSSCSLIEFYSRNGRIGQAKLVFEKLEARNVVTWSSMISCCMRHKQMEDALWLFHDMICTGIEPNEYTFAALLGACGMSSEFFSVGRQLHCPAIKLNLVSDNRILNALITMYGRSGDVDNLERVFERIEKLDVVSWCAAISSYFQNGYDEKSLKLVSRMHKEGFVPNEYGLSSTLSSCANLASLDQGKHFHCLALKAGCDLDVCVGNALINMYAKCGSIEDARLIFDAMPDHDLMSWNSLIHGYAHHGNGNEAISVFNTMMDAHNIMPDHSTFVGILVACSHVGCVGQAFRYFDTMLDQYGIMPSASHFACIVDMMGSAGRLMEALQIINEMPFEPDVLIWKTMLASCKLHKNLELGKLAAEKVIELTPKDSAGYVLLSNMHAMRGEWKDAESVRTMMDEHGIKKGAGCSWIQISSEVHVFTASDGSHEKADSVYFMLNLLYKELKVENGCSAEMIFVSYDL
ncbi:putative tetratricopeptide-like helical domain superfamily [Dioscorea sansibarensis]